MEVSEFTKDLYTQLKNKFNEYRIAYTIEELLYLFKEDLKEARAREEGIYSGVVREIDRINGLLLRIEQVYARTE